MGNFLISNDATDNLLSTSQFVWIKFTLNVPTLHTIYSTLFGLSWVYYNLVGSYTLHVDHKLQRLYCEITGGLTLKILSGTEIFNSSIISLKVRIKIRVLL